MTISKPLDRETNEMFQLNISAKDYGHPRMFAYKRLTVYVVDVNDNAPVFEHSVYIANITEQQDIGSLVTTIRATDTDQGKLLEIF